MGVESKIQWCDHTVNFWTGCEKVSPGCKYCYMYRDKDRYGQDGRVILKTSKRTIMSVLKKAKPGDKIFTCSWSDFFITTADSWRAEAWEIIKSRPDLIWIILTKRPERIAECLPEDWGVAGLRNYPYVWFGVSVEDENHLYRLVDLCFEPKLRYSTLFMSYEPALGGLSDIEDDASVSSAFDKLDWVIVGGESGNDRGKWRYRKCELEWLEYMVKLCKEKKIPVFVKQLGTHLAKELKLKDRHGGDIEEFPEVLRVREFPR